MTNGSSPQVMASHTTRASLVAFAMLQITLGAGLIVGWTGIAGTLLVVPIEEGGAGLTLDQTTQLYGLAAAVNYVSPLFLGMLLDNFGPRACSTVANMIVALGLAVFSSGTQLSTFAVGVCLVAFGGPGVQTSVLSVGNLFPKRRFFVMGMTAETITLSFAIFPLLDVIWEALPPGYSFRWCFAALAVLVTLSAVCSSILWPDKPFKIMTAGGATATEETALLKELDPEEAVGHLEKLDLTDLSFVQQLSSGVYIRLSIFFLVTSFWANFYIATVTTELGDQQLFDEDEQHLLTRWLSFLDAGAFLCAPLSGFLLDSVGFPFTAFVTVVLGLFQQGTLLMAGAHVDWMIASFGAYAVFRAFLFPYFFASVSRKMGFKHFGMLSGVSFCVSGFSQLAIAPLAKVVEGDCHELKVQNDDCNEGGWATIHWIQIVSLSVLLLIPIFENQHSPIHKGV